MGEGGGVTEKSGFKSNPNKNLKNYVLQLESTNKFYIYNLLRRVGQLLQI